MTSYTEATHNVFFELNPDKWRQDFAKSKADVTRYQECGGDAQQRALSDWCRGQGRTLYSPDDCDNPISWDPKVFSSVMNAKGHPIRGVVQVHPGAPAFGIHYKIMPPRSFTYVGLVHKESKRRVLIINAHPWAGATTRESASKDKGRPDVMILKDWSIGQYWLDIVAFTAKQMSRSRGKIEEMRPFWDIVSLGGDYNAALSNRREWYYPSRMLTSLYHDDVSKYDAGLDHMQLTRGSDAVVKTRHTVDGYTDHSIHHVTYAFRDKPDFPRDK